MNIVTMLFVGSACERSDVGQIVLVVNSDLRVPEELDAVYVDAQGADGLERNAEARLTGSGSTSLPRRLTLVNRHGRPDATLNVHVIGSLRGSEVLRRDLTLRFEDRATKALRVELLRSCVGVACPEGQTCGSSGCRAPFVSANELLDWPITSLLPDASLPERDASLAPRDAFLPDGASACGQLCSSRNPGVVEASCVAGQCVLVCAEGRADCDDIVENGCESSLREAENCGGCHVPCRLAHAVSSCGSGQCTVISCASGFDNCDERPENGCETDIATDMAHCGRCAQSCPPMPDNAASLCDMGRCQLRCDPGFADCDGRSENGCEASIATSAHCGDCSVSCIGSAPLCESSGSRDFTCKSGCTLTLCGKSCVDTNRDVLHCGGCDHPCIAPPHASSSCVGGECRFACDPKFDDCDHNSSNGCETSLNTVENCGVCGVVCAPAGAIASCEDGRCIIASCRNGFGDCDGDSSNGCEANLGEPDHCGTCTTMCRPSQKCCGGQCRKQKDC